MINNLPFLNLQLLQRFTLWQVKRRLRKAYLLEPFELRRMASLTKALIHSGFISAALASMPLATRPALAAEPVVSDTVLSSVTPLLSHSVGKSRTTGKYLFDGSAVVISAQGDVVLTDHTVDEPWVVNLTFKTTGPDGVLRTSVLKADVTHTDWPHDLAFARIRNLKQMNAAGVKPMPFGPVVLKPVTDAADPVKIDTGAPAYYAGFPYKAGRASKAGQAVLTVSPGTIRDYKQQDTINVAAIGTKPELYSAFCRVYTDSRDEIGEGFSGGAFFSLQQGPQGEPVPALRGIISASETVGAERHVIVIPAEHIVEIFSHIRGNDPKRADGVIAPYGWPAKMPSECQFTSDDITTIKKLSMPAARPKPKPQVRTSSASAP